MQLVIIGAAGNRRGGCGLIPGCRAARAARENHREIHPEEAWLGAEGKNLSVVRNGNDVQSFTKEILG
jgi:hypothetical protein